MRASVVTISLIIAVTVARGDELLDEIIYNANLDNVKNHLDVIQVPASTYDHLGFVFNVRNGQAMNFSTIALRGDNQVLNQTDYAGYSKLDFALTVGLDHVNVVVEYDYRLFHFIKGSGVLSISNTKNAVFATGIIISNDNGSCEATLDSAELTEIGDFDIDITPHSIGKTVLKKLISFVSNYILPHLKFVINRYIRDIVKNEVPNSNFSKIVCKPLVV